MGFKAEYFESVNLIGVLLQLFVVSRILAKLGVRAALLFRRASQNRFRAFLSGIVAALATPERPLVLFVDDLQWLDPATFGLIEDPLCHDGVRNLLIVGACRGNEVVVAAPLLRARAALRGRGIAVTEVAIAPLSPADVGRPVADTLRGELRVTQALATVVNAKTGGNPPSSWQ